METASCKSGKNVTTQQSPHKSYKPRRNSINNINNFNKTGMIPGALLQYFNKSPKPTKEPEITPTVPTTTKSVVNEISQIGKELLKRCESPEIVYLGTFQTSIKSNENNVVTVSSGGQDDSLDLINVENNNHNNSVPVITTTRDPNNSAHSGQAQDNTVPLSEKSNADGQHHIVGEGFIKKEIHTTGVENSSRNELDIDVEFDTPQQQKNAEEVEEKENNNDIEQQQSSSLLIINEELSLDNAENNHEDTIETSSNNNNNSDSQLDMKMNVQTSLVSVVLPSFGSMPSKDDRVLDPSRKVNVTDFYRNKKRQNSLLNQKKRKFDDVSKQQTSSSQLNPTTIAKRRRSSGSSSNSSSSSKGSISISKSKVPVPMSKEVCQRLSSLIEKKRFKDALSELSAMLDGIIPVYPNAQILADIIQNGIFGRNRDMHLTAYTYFEKLVRTLEINVTTQDLYEDTFSSVLDPELFVGELLRDMKQDLEKRPEEKFKLKFFKAFTSLLVKEYTLYSEQSVKLRHPLIVVLMSKSRSSETGQTSEFNDLWKKFLRAVIQLPSSSEEAQTGMKWITIAGHHFRNLSHKWNTSYQTLVEFLISEIIDVGLQDYGLEFLKLLDSRPLALEVCAQLLRSLWQCNDHDDKWDNVLYELSANLPVLTVARRASINNQQVPLSNDQFLKFLTEKINVKGESRLHLACGQKKLFPYEGHQLNYKQILHKMRKSKLGDINIRDNADNTPLHEVCYHGNTDVLTEIWNCFSTENEPPGPQRVDVLAQNHNGESALHNAVDRKHVDCLNMLLLLAQYLKCESQLLRLRNRWDLTAWDLIKDAESNEQNERIKEILSSRTPRPRRTMYAGVKLSDSAVDNIESNHAIRDLIMYWRTVHDNSKKKTTAIISPLDSS